jgi:PAS domain-containing protein
MELFCSFCTCYLGVKEPIADTRRTHGICPDCLEDVLRQQGESSFDEYLDQFGAPVLVVDGQGRVAAANGAALALLGKPYRRVQGLLGGEAMECAWARLPGGCGQTIHCTACTIRNLVMETMRDKQGRRRRWVSLTREAEVVDMLITTINHENTVRIVIEEIRTRARGGETTAPSARGNRAQGMA